ncbi:hypothetical protein BHE97_04920 [Aeromicrobium sp. PE09-221]|nr:hypothetical protein BHE97_04920 [Aeromicrobium sp. PE09-221]
MVQALASIAGVVPLFALTQLAHAAAHGHSADLIGWILAGSIAALLRAALHPCAFALSHRADADLQHSLRERVVAQLSRLPLRFFDERSSAQVKRTVTDDVGALHHLVGHALLDLASLVVTPAAVIVALAATAPELLPAALLPVAAGIALHRRAMRRIAGTMPQFQSAVTELDAAATEFVRAIAPVRLFGAEHRVHGRFDDAARQYAGFLRSWARGLTGPSNATQLAFAPLTATVVTAVAGAALADAGHTDVISVGAAVVLAPALGAPFLPLTFALQDVGHGRAALRRIGDFLGEETVRDAPVLPPAALGEPVTVTLHDVAIAYGDRPAVTGIDLDLRPGRVVALVGRSGAGKSTIAQAVAGLRPITVGRMTLNGLDYADLDEQDVVSRIAWVPQDPRLLRASVRDNIALAAPAASLQEVVNAARVARIADRIAALPDGYDTVVGEGIELSGGEAQRVCVARSVLTCRGVLVMDEATSALDQRTQREVLQGLATVRAERAVLVVAHRLETVRDADEIVVLDEGRIVERGRHEDLLACDDHYARLWSEQQGVTC